MVNIRAVSLAAALVNSGLASSETTIRQDALQRICNSNPSLFVKWEPECAKRSLPGCNAGGKFHECKYCGTAETGDCEADPKNSQAYLQKKCNSNPSLPVVWEPECAKRSLVGCNAGGLFHECRYISGTNVEDYKILLPVLICDDDLRRICGSNPSLPVEWEPECRKRSLVGCNAGGKYHECRYVSKSPVSSFIPDVPVVSSADSQPVLRITQLWTITQADLHSICSSVTWLFIKWEPECRSRDLPGCNAGGVFPECKYCGNAETGDCEESPDITQAELQKKCQSNPSLPVAWEPECAKRSLVGCNAGGLYHECRYISGTVFVDESQRHPASLCQDDLQRICGSNPSLPVEWEPECRKRSLVGCNAGGKYHECRYVSKTNFDDKAPAWTSEDNPRRLLSLTMRWWKISQADLHSICSSVTWLFIKWEPKCRDRDLPGCNAGGVFLECKYCGNAETGDCEEGPENIQAKLQEKCQSNPSLPVQWEPECAKRSLVGCNAGGLYHECRYISGTIFDDESQRHPASVCQDDLQRICGSNPSLPVEWEPECRKRSLVGCNAGGKYHECRYVSKSDVDGNEVGSTRLWDGRMIFTKLITMSQDVLQRICGSNPSMLVKWEPECAKRSLVGCNAGGRYHECKYCGTAENGDCQENPPITQAELQKKCQSNPSLPVEWEPECAKRSLVGCNAGGLYHECRYISGTKFEDYKAKTTSELCQDDLHLICGLRNPSIIIVWEPECRDRLVAGCNAGGKFQECKSMIGLEVQLALP